MIHIALRVAYLLFLVWLGLNVLLFTVLGVVALFSRLSRAPANEAQGPSLTDSAIKPLTSTTESEIA
jgi:hypothetical protein